MICNLGDPMSFRHPVPDAPNILWKDAYNVGKDAYIVKRLYILCIYCEKTPIT